MNKLKKAALLMVAKTMSQDQIQGLKELFKSIDRDNSGTITVEELRVALQANGRDVSVSYHTVAKFLFHFFLPLMGSCAKCAFNPLPLTVYASGLSF